jgi:hypothetical protein
LPSSLPCDRPRGQPTRGRFFNLLQWLKDMALPKAYEPAEGYKYQLLCRNPQYGREWEHCDYAKDRAERNHLLHNYRMAYGAGWEFKTIPLPRKYHPATSCNA